MALAVTREQLHRIPTEDGSVLVMGVFLGTFDGAYALLGDELDLSGFMRQVVDIQVIAEDTGRTFTVVNTGFPAARPRIRALQIPTLVHEGAAPHPAHPTQPSVALPAFTTGSPLLNVRIRCVVWGLG